MGSKDRPSVDIEVRVSKPEDAYALGPKLRKADKDELWAYDELDGTESLIEGFTKSAECYTIVLRDVPIAMFGVVAQDGIGWIWLLGTDALPGIRYTFLRWSRVWLEELKGKYSKLMNVIDARNTVHISWLDWLGFKLDKFHPGIGRHGEDFWEFSK